MRHILKTDPDVFDLVVSGKKPLKFDLTIEIIRPAIACAYAGQDIPATK